ncbi:MAG: PAS domain S-box protein [Chloroflexi bacterium]|nr:PAS domain S-box protein [Chloroflexota bacterium]
MAQNTSSPKTAENGGERDLRESERRYQRLFNTMLDGYYRSTHDGRFIEVNPAMVRMFGYASREEMLGVDIKKELYFAPEERGSHILDTGQEEIETYRMRRKDGSEIWVEDHGSYVHDEQGNIIYHEGILRDITERRRAEERYHLQSAALDAAANAIAITDLNGIIQWVNPAFTALTGYSFGEVIGKNPRDVVRSGLHSREFYENLWQTIRSGHVWRGEVINRRKDGSLYTEEQTITPVKNEEGNVTHFISIRHDITERRRVEDALRESEQNYRLLAESSQDIITLVNPNFEVEYINSFGAHQLRAMPQELIGRRLDDIFSTEIARRQKGNLQKVFDSGESVQVESLFAFFGTNVWLDTSLVPIKDESNRVNAVLVMSRDITERKQAEETIRQRLAEQSILHQASQSLLSVDLDPDAIYTTLHRAVSQIMPCDAFNIVLEDKGNGDYHGVYLYDDGQRYPAKRVPRGQGLSGKVIARGETLFIHDNQQDNVPAVRYGSPKSVRSILAVPLRKNNVSVGMVSTQSYRPNVYNDRHRVLFETLAAQVTTIIENARLFEETNRRAREFESLYQTSNAISAENDLDTLLKVIVENARKLLDSATSGIYLYHPEKGELEFTVDIAHFIPLGTRLQLNEGAAGRVAQTHRPLRIDDYSNWEGRSTQHEGLSIRAVLEVPMLYGGELIGVLTADEMGGSERKFTEAEERLLSLFASQAAGAIHSARLREQTARRLNQLQALHTIDRAISSSFDLRPILKTVISQTIAQLNVDAVAVLLFNPHLQTLEYIAGQGFHTRAIEQSHLRLGEGHAGRAAFSRRTVHIPNLPESGSNFARASLLASEGFVEYYGVPLIAKGEVKGVLEVLHRAPLRRDSEWVNFLETLAGQAAITINQTQLFDELQRANLELVIAYDATIEGWSHAIDLRDRETESHTPHVMEMTLALASSMGIPQKEMLHVRRGVILHDIGKMGIPDSILLKNGKLTPAEQEIMHKHPAIAYEMLKPIAYLRQSLDIPYCHHETWDGSGYPRGLKGEEIPLAARIFSIVDFWDTVSIARPYRKAWSKQKALKYIREQSGKHFDPQVVEAFIKLISKPST